jgi:PAS domain S-box-containing protein
MLPHFDDPLNPDASDRCARLLQSLADAVVVADPAGAIVLWNQAATNLFGWSEEEAVGRSLDLIIPERLRGRHWDGYRRVMESGHTEYGSRLLEVPAVHRDGHTLSIAFTVTLLVRPGEQRPEAIAAVLRDDTARRRELLELRERVATLETATEGSGAGDDRPPS